MQFAREGVETVAGWRGEINIPGLTQVRPDLLVQVAEGPLGAGTYYIKYERYVVRPAWAREKLVPYRKMAAIGRPLPMLMVCEAEQGEEQYQAASGRLPMLTATLERALAGPLTGAKTVWQRNGEAAALHSKR